MRTVEGMLIVERHSVTCPECMTRNHYFKGKISRISFALQVMYLNNYTVMRKVASLNRQ